MSEPDCAPYTDTAAVYPSDMTTGLLAQNPSGVYPKDYIPEERVGDVKDMAGAILFLASRAGGYVNGNVLLTDGGRLSVLPATY
jgi:NAD(P)-dependent dehydrogenase (short-subunit alcohol dehydrogenase family)